jgi:hypothetical protein
MPSPTAVKLRVQAGFVSKAQSSPHKFGRRVSRKFSRCSEALGTITYYAPRIACLDIGEDFVLIHAYRAAGFERFVVRIR